MKPLTLIINYLLERIIVCPMVLLLFLFISTSLFAQIKPFEDYSKCQTGFLKANGDTLYKAQFESVKEIELTPEGILGSGAKAWMVVFNKKTGCLDETGKWLVECKYDVVNYYVETALFLVKKESTSGVFNLKGEVVIPFEYAELTYRDEDGYKSFLAVKNNLRTVFDVSGKVIIPPSGLLSQFRYKSIDPAKQGTHIYEYGNYVNGQRQSRLKDGFGNDLSPKNVEEIQLLHDRDGYAEDEKLCVVYDKNRNLALAHFDGKPITRYFDKKNNIKLVSYIAPNSSVVTYRHVILQFYKNGDAEQLFNIKTGKLSEVYDEIDPFGDYFIATKGKETSVLNSDLEVVYKTKLRSKLLCYFDTYGNILDDVGYLDPWRKEFGEEVLPQHLYEKIDELLVLQKEVEPPKSEYSRGIDSKMIYQLIQTKTGKIYEQKYDNVFRAVSKEGIFVWAMNYANDSVLVDVYSFDGSFIRSLSFHKSQREQLENELSIMKTEDEKMVDASIWITSGPSRYKGFHHNGMALTGWNFGQNAELIYSDGKSRHIIRERYYGGDFKYYDQSHVPLYNEEFYSDTINLGNQAYYIFNIYPDEVNGYSIAKKKADAGGYKLGGLILDREFNIVNNDLAGFSSSTDQNVLKVKENPYYIFFKNDYYYYVFSDGKLKILDSSMFVHPAQVNAVPGTYNKVDTKGKLYQEQVANKTTNKPIQLVGNNRFSLKNNVLTIMDYDKKKTLLVIEDVLNYTYDYHQSVTIQLTNQKYGILNSKTLLWVAQPIYAQVYPHHSSSDEKLNVYWAKDSAKNGKWFPMNSSGKPLAKPIFDEYFFMMKDKLSNFKSNGKIGLIDNNYKVVVQPSYDAFIRHENVPVYMKAGKPYLVFQPSGKAMEITHDISDFFVNKNYLFIYNDTLEVVSNEGTVLIPATPVEKAMKNYNLVNYFIFPKEGKTPLPYIHNQEVFSSNTDLAMRYYSNHIIIDEALANMKEVDQLGIRPPQSIEYTFRIRNKIEPVWISKNLCTERVYGKYFPESANKYPNFADGCGYRVYEIKKDTCIQLTVQELTKDDAASRKKLDDLIRAEIQRKQSFGLVCSDMDAAVEEFKLNFSVDNRYIYFTNQTLQEYITINISELNGILRHPEWFSNN